MFHNKFFLSFNKTTITEMVEEFVVSSCEGGRAYEYKKDQDSQVPENRVLLFTDATIKTLDFGVSGFVQATCNTIIIPPKDPNELIDQTLPWVGHIINHNLSVNKPWPVELIVSLLEPHGVTAEQISSVYIVAGLKDERLRCMYRNKSSQDNATDACNLIEYFLNEAKEQFTNSKIVWLGLGRVKTGASTYKHIEAVTEQAAGRIWPYGIEFQNIFQKVDNSDIRNHYGQLNVSGNRKVMTMLKSILKNG